MAWSGGHCNWFFLAVLYIFLLFSNSYLDVVLISLGLFSMVFRGHDCEAEGISTFEKKECLRRNACMYPTRRYLRLSYLLIQKIIVFSRVQWLYLFGEIGER
jgi:hypothetical protein